MNAPGLAGRIADRFVDSKLVPLIVIATILVGAYGLVATPREDRPDIEVPTALITLPFVGGGTERVDELVALPVSAWAAQLERVVDVESVASADAALIRVEFVSGMSDAAAYGELKEVLESNRHRLPRGVGEPVIRTLGDEILTGLMITLSSERLSGYELRRLGDELAVNLEEVRGVRAVDVHGGQLRQVQVLPRPRQLAARGIGLLQLYEAIAAADLRLPAEPLRGDVTRPLRVGSSPRSVGDIEAILVDGGPAGPVQLRDVAEVVDGPAPADSHSVHWQRGSATELPAVSLSLSGVPNSNISAVTRRALDRLDQLSAELLPQDVRVTVAYDAGQVATDTVASVLRNFLTATVTVILIILIGLGWRAALGVSLQIPSSLAIVPIAYLWLGFTLNPVSLAAMILAIGLLADDNIIILENIRRHYRAAGERSRELTVRAVDEVGNPTILAVILIIATLLPTAFITGEMGQYSRAIPIGTSLAIGFSLVIALTVTPYLAYRILSSPQSREAEGGPKDSKDIKADAREVPSGRLADVYGVVLQPFFANGWLRWLLYLLLAALLAGSIAMVWFRAVQVTLVPLLDRDVFVVELELPPGSPLESTLAAGAALGRELRSYPEVHAYTLFAGTDGPMLMPPPGPPDIHNASSHRASIYVQFVPEGERDSLSFEIGRDFAFTRLPAVLENFGARAWIRSIPSGPSSENDIEAEITGRETSRRERLALQLERLLEQHPAAGAIERFPKPAGPEVRLAVDPVRAAARGVVPARVAATVQTALSGRAAAEMDFPGERRPVPVVVRLAKNERGSMEDVAGLYVRSEQGRLVPLMDLVDVRQGQGAVNRHRRNQLPTTYVAARVDRGQSQPVSVQRDIVKKLRQQDVTQPELRWFSVPENDRELTLFWSGEWQMTAQVYRDLGLAGLAVLLLVYVVLTAWSRSYLVPVLIMIPIPLVIIGVIPGHWMMGLDIAGLGVLGIIALAGIVVRNALLLVDFTQRRLGQGLGLEEALIGAGVVRTRPILLTAGTVLFGSGALILEPALKPLGLTLAAGVLVSTLLTLVLIPVMYYHLFEQRIPKRGETHKNRSG